MFLEHHIRWEPLIPLRKKEVSKLGRERVPYHKVKQQQVKEPSSIGPSERKNAITLRENDRKSIATLKK